MAKMDFVIIYLGLFLIIIVALVIGSSEKIEMFTKRKKKTTSPPTTSPPTIAPLPLDLRAIMSDVILPAAEYADIASRDSSFFSFFNDVSYVAYGERSGLKDSSYLYKSNPAFQTYVTRVDTFYTEVNSGKYSGIGDPNTKQVLLTSIQKLKDKLNEYPLII